MQFLKTLFWVVLTTILVLWGKANWIVVPLKLWGGLIADVRLPILILFGFLVGFVPTLIVYRARLWSLRRRLEPLERNAAGIGSVSAPVSAATPVVVTNSADARVATDSEAWPTA
jgi:putative membrane protein